MRAVAGYLLPGYGNYEKAVTLFYFSDESEASKRNNRSGRNCEAGKASFSAHHDSTTGFVYTSDNGKVATVNLVSDHVGFVFWGRFTIVLVELTLFLVYHLWDGR